jgi:hypothetical protein
MIDLRYFKFRIWGEPAEIVLSVTLFIIIFLYIHFPISILLFYTTGITIQVLFAVLSLQTKWRRSVWYIRVCTVWYILV